MTAILNVALLGASGRMGLSILPLLAESADLRLSGALAAPGDSSIGQDAGAFAGTALLAVPISADASVALAGAQVAVDFTLPAVSLANADGETRVVVAYVEGVADGRRFLSTLTRVAALKPVVVLKTGRSAEGARAVSSHTGALAGSDAAFDAAVKQAGAVRARSVEELFDLARALAVQPLPRGRRLLILTNGGGLGIVAADAAHEAGLTLPPPGDDARSRLRAVLPRAASVENPIDIVGDADAARYANALGAAGPEGADAALVVLTAQAATESVSVARAILGATRDWPIPLATTFVGGGRVAPGARALEEAGVPCYAFPEHAVAALGGMARLAERRRRPPTIAWPEPPAAARLLLSALGAHPATAILGMTDLAALLTPGSHAAWRLQTHAKCAIRQVTPARREAVGALPGERSRHRNLADRV